MGKRREKEDGTKNTGIGSENLERQKIVRLSAGCEAAAQKPAAFLQSVAKPHNNLAFSIVNLALKKGAFRLLAEYSPVFVFWYSDITVWAAMFCSPTVCVANKVA